MKNLFRRGTRMFTVASLLTLVVAMAHMTGLTNEPFNDDWATAIDAMNNATLELGPMMMSFHGLFVGLWVQVGVLVALVGVKNLAVLVVMPGEVAGRVARALCVIDCITCAGLTAFFAVNVVPPALVSFAILTITYFAGAILTRTNE